MSKLDLINGRIKQGSENPAYAKRKEESDKKRKSKEKRPYWKKDWRK